MNDVCLVTVSWMRAVEQMRRGTTVKFRQTTAKSRRSDRNVKDPDSGREQSDSRKQYRGNQPIQ